VIAISQPRVSFVIPAHNEQRFLARALRSAQRQTVRDIEIVVVDDHSTDRTSMIVASAAARDPRIRLIPNAGQGFVDAQNTGIRASRGSLIARLDADDIALPRRLERQLAEFDANSALVAVGTWGRRINELGMRVSRLRTGPVGSEGYRQAMANDWPINLTHSSVLYRRDTALEVGGYNQDYYPADDHRLWSCMAQHGEVYALPEILTLYRLRFTSMSVTHAEGMALQVTRAMRERKQLLTVPSGPAAFGSGPAVRVGDNDDDFDVRRQQWAQLAHARRRLARALANGRLPTAVRVARAEGLDISELRRIMRRARRG